MRKLENKIVFINGGNSGIGKASALEAAREGANVVIADLEKADHDDTMQQLTVFGARSLFVPIPFSSNSSGTLIR